jgi:putative ABC transport system permease protein
MIALAWHTTRARAASLAGSFIAVALGVSLLAAMALILASSVGAPSHPRWFSKPDVVVAGANSISITTG